MLTSPRRRFAAVVTLLLGGQVAAAVVPQVAHAVTSLSVPAGVPYAVDGPATVLPVSFTVDHATSYVHLELGGLIADATCHTGPTPLAVAPAGGTAVITTPLTAGSLVACDVTLAQLPETAPDPTDFVVTESDEFNSEITHQSSTVTFRTVSPAATIGEVSLETGTYVAYEPRRVGDVLVAPVTVTLATDEAVTVAASSPNTVDCPDPTSGPTELSCTLRRTLSADDLLTGSVDLGATVLADGFAVAAVTLPVPAYAEHRIVVDASASPVIVRAGDTTTVTATIQNVGTTDLSAVALAGGGVASYDCSPTLAGLVLAPGAQVVCTGTHLATATEADGTSSPAITVRATQPFGVDSDASDDDATSSTDVDGVADVPFTVTAADVAAQVTVDQPVIFVPATDVTSREVSVTLSSVGALTDVELVVPAQLSAGVVVDCTAGIDEMCRFPLGDLAAGIETATVIPVVVDAGVIGDDRFAALDLPVRVAAAGGLDIDLGSATFSTAGAVATLATDLVDASDDTITTSVAIDMQAGVGAHVTLHATATPSVGAGAEITACAVVGGAAVALVPAGGDVELGAVAAGSHLTCDVQVPVDNAIRSAGSVGLAISGAVTVDSQARPLAAEGTVPVAALVIEPLAAGLTPEHGYSVAGGDVRPNTASQGFRVTAYGAGTALTSVAALEPDTEVDCDSRPVSAIGEPASMDCTVEHTITADDLDASTAQVGVHAIATAGDLQLDRQGTTEIATPQESVALRVTELSAPANSVYDVGDTVRLLLHVTNNGTMPLNATSVGVELIPTVDGGDPTELELASKCKVPLHLAPGGGADCVVTFQLREEHVGLSGAALIASATMDEGIRATTPIQLSVYWRGALAAGSVLKLTAAGQAGVPDDATAAAFNFTAVAPAAAGYLTVWPCGSAKPATSNLNYSPGENTAGLVISKLGAEGTVCVYTSAAVNLVVDVNGYSPAESGFVAIQPVRQTDTRQGTRPVGGVVVEVPVRGTAVPADAVAAVLTVTAVRGDEDGFVTVWPCGEPLPEVSSLNYRAGRNRANLVVAMIGANDAICVSPSSSVDIVVDVAGYVTGSQATLLVPHRDVDTRSGVPLSPANVLQMDAPAGAGAVLVNLTATRAAAAGYAVVWSCDDERPLASNLNFRPGTNVANFVIAKVGPSGTICIAASQTVHIVVDVFGTFTAIDSYQPLTPQRVVDTRR